MKLGYLCPQEQKKNSLGGLEMLARPLIQYRMEFLSLKLERMLQKGGGVRTLTVTLPKACDPLQIAICTLMN